MSAQIRSSIPSKPTVDSASRDDLAVGDVVTVEAVPPAVGTTWAWSLAFVPEGSSAVLTPPLSVTTSGPLSFTVDLEGPYLVRLIVDAGLPSEDTQYVRLRALTTSLGLKLVAAGERRDSGGVIPVDADIEGWANDQNANLLALESALNVLQDGVTLEAQPSDPGGTSAGQGTYWVRDDSPTEPVFTDSAGTDWDLVRVTSGGVPIGSPIVYHHAVPPAPNDTVEYRGWVPYDAVLVSVRAYMGTLNSQGTYTLDVVNVATGDSCLLGGAPFDMNGLVADTVTSVPLKATGDADLSFGAAGRWTYTLVSDDPGFDGLDIVVELVFGVV